MVLDDNILPDLLVPHSSDALIHHHQNNPPEEDEEDTFLPGSNPDSNCKSDTDVDEDGVMTGLVGLILCWRFMLSPQRAQYQCSIFQQFFSFQSILL
jgi:hypothetical protein